MKAKINKELFSKGNAVVGIIGQGYVGLPLALLFAESGLRTIGFDVDRSKVDMLNRGKSFIEYIPSDRIRKLRKKKIYQASADLQRLGEADAVIICVPTPLDHHLQPDVSFIVKSAQAIARKLRPGQLIVLESTSYPGCTRSDVLPALEATGLKLDRDFAVAFSPEREDPSNKSFSTHNIPKLVGGLTELGGELAFSLYARAIKTVVKVDSAEVAESSKLLENIFRSVNIAMVNELKIVFQKMGIDIWQVIKAASTKPFGFMPFYPGPGLGGHCIPIDPFYLTWKAREVGEDTLFIELAGQINRSMPAYVVRRLADALNARGKPVAGSRILVLGFSYKKNVGDYRESPTFEIYELLHRMQAKIDYYDPYIPGVRPTREHKLCLRPIKLTPKAVAGYDSVVIVTDHDGLDYNMIRKHSRLVIDTRNVYPGNHPNVVKA
ncbi:MAG: nucleotide sugar dehydrogenase [Kiritimatiellia bacterium]